MKDATNPAVVCRSFIVPLCFTLCLLLCSCAKSERAEREAAPAYQPSPVAPAPQVKMPEVAAPKLAEVQEAVKRVFKDAAVVDTSIIAALTLYDPSELPDTILITAVTLGELSFGPHATDDPIKRAGRVAVLQHVEATFDPLPYDQDAARLYGQICAAVRTAGREPRRRTSDLMIAATAAGTSCVHVQARQSVTG